MHDLQPLVRMQVLVSLNLAKAHVQDISVLAQLSNLRYLSLESAPIRDLTPLHNLVKLS